MRNLFSKAILLYDITKLCNTKKKNALQILLMNINIQKMIAKNDSNEKFNQ